MNSYELGITIIFISTLQRRTLRIRERSQTAQPVRLKVNILTEPACFQNPLQSAMRLGPPPQNLRSAVELRLIIPSLYFYHIFSPIGFHSHVSYTRFSASEYSDVCVSPWLLLFLPPTGTFFMPSILLIITTGKQAPPYLCITIYSVLTSCCNYLFVSASPIRPQATQDIQLS